MAQLHLGDIKLVLRDFLGKRRPLLEASAAGRFYLPLLQTRLDAIEALPPGLTSRPLADELAAEDHLHDGFGSAVWYFCQAFVHHPALTADLRAAAERIRATFIPSLGELRRPYADEAVAAQQHEPEIERLAAELARFPLPGGGTLRDWVEAFVGQGKKIEGLLSQRGEVTATLSGSERRQVTTLRSSTVGLLGRLRASLEDEMTIDPELNRSMADQVFGYHDELLRLRAEQLRARASAKTPSPQPTTPQPTPTMTPSQPTPQPTSSQATTPSQPTPSQTAPSQSASLTAPPQATAPRTDETR
jgi:hypothetical protein